VARPDPVMTISIAVLVVVGLAWTWRYGRPRPPSDGPNERLDVEAFDADRNSGDATKPTARLAAPVVAARSAHADVAAAELALMFGGAPDPSRSTLSSPPEDIVALFALDPFLAERLSTPEGLAMIEAASIQAARDAIRLRSLHTDVASRHMSRARTQPAPSSPMDSHDDPVEAGPDAYLLQQLGEGGTSNPVVFRRASHPELFAISDASRSGRSEFRATVLRWATTRFPELIR
jgi:hypothetical protein